jgi:hypothetical protein
MKTILKTKHLLAEITPLGGSRASGSDADRCNVEIKEATCPQNDCNKRSMMMMWTNDIWNISLSEVIHILKTHNARYCSYHHDKIFGGG